MKKQYKSIEELGTIESIQLRDIGGFYSRWENVTTRQHNKIVLAVKKPKNVYGVPNYRAIKVKFLFPTNNRGLRIKFWEEPRSNTEEKKSIVFPVSNTDMSESDSLSYIGHEILKRNNFDIICRHSDANTVTFLCDNWAEDFKEIKEIKK